MPNWFKDLTRDTMEDARYRAIFPIDVMVPESGNEETNKNTVYKTITDTLNGTPLTNFQLNTSDIERYTGRT